MRGCLSVLVLAIAFVAIAIWFGGPPLASAVVQSTLTGNGFVADALDVEVTADPPLTLAVGRARSIDVTASGVHWNNLRMTSLVLSLGSVDLVARTASTAEGSFSGVELPGAGGDPVVADVTFSGPAAAARTTITVDAVTVDRLAVDAFQAEFGLRPSSVSLAEPDTVRVALGGLTVNGQLAIAADGSLVALATGRTVRLVAPDPTLPLRLSSLSVTDGDLVLRGTFDVSTLLR
jgi:hypothetical protein